MNEITGNTMTAILFTAQ